MPVHIAAAVNLTERSAELSHVTPLPGSRVGPSRAEESRLSLRVRLPDGTTRTEPVVFKPDVCRLPGEDETGLVDSVVAIEPDASGIDLLVDNEPVASFEAIGGGGEADNVRVERRAADRGPGATGGISAEGSVLTWEDPAGGAARGPGSTRYAVQASTDGGRTWTTLAVGATDTSLPIEPEQFADADRVRFRVLASTGFSHEITATADVPVEEL